MSERRTPYTTRGKPRQPSPGGTLRGTSGQAGRALWPGETLSTGFTPPPAEIERIADFCRCFDTWIMNQSETVKLSSGLAFGDEYRRLRGLVEIAQADFNELTHAHRYIAALEDALGLAQAEIAKLKAQLAADDAWEAMDK